MWLSPALVLMILSIFSSIILVISSPSLFISWIGLELNTLAFLPILLGKNNSISSEASIKYFLTQTLASILIILSALLFFMGLSVLASLLLVVSLGIKLGAAPFHTWLLSVSEVLSWGGLFTLLTIQKINPLLIMWGFLPSTLGITELLIILSLGVGGLLGLVQTSTRLLMAFSSINHLGWLMTSLSFDLWMGILYFFIYSAILLAVILIFNSFNISHINQFVMVNFNSSKQILMHFSILSLGGLPPFTGFLPKWLILQSMMTVGWYFLSLIMILSSLFTLFFYLRMVFSSFIMSSMNVSTVGMTYSLSSFNLMLIALSILGLPLFLFL